MGTLGRTLSLISFAVGIVISVLVYAQYSQTQKSMIGLIDKNVSATTFDVHSLRRAQDDSPSLSVAKIAAPKNGSEARSFEIEHVDEMAQTGDIVYDQDLPASTAEETAPQLSPDASLGEKVQFYWGRLSAWLFGEREETVEMSCKPKQGGGKVCTVSRG